MLYGKEKEKYLTRCVIVTLEFTKKTLQRTVLLVWKAQYSHICKM